jgi:RND family efflux transporter MFP subunit
VKKGQAIFELMPLSATERDARAEAERIAEEARARLTEAEQRLERQNHLLADGAVSARGVEEATATRDVAKAADGAARDRLAALERLRVGPRGEMAMTAPFDGVVTALRAAAGQSVSAGAPLFEVAQISTLWVRVPLYAGELSTVATDKPASVAAHHGEGPEAWLTAQPVKGPLTADPSVASADLFYEIANDGEVLRPGERLAVRLPLRGSEQSLVVPQSAIVYDLTGGTWVYEARAPHVFARRRVEIEGPAGAGVIVRRGLAEGVRIVTVGAAELYGTEFFVGK